MPTKKTSAPSRLQPVILGLLVLVLFGTMALIGILVTDKGAKTDIIGADAASCQEYVKAAQAAEQNTCEPKNNVMTAKETDDVPAGDGSLGFLFPSSWSVITGNDNPESNWSWYAKLVPGYFFMCEGCDGPFLPITMNVGLKSDASVTAYATFSEYVAAQFTDPSYTDVEISATKDVGGERYTVTGTLNGLYTGPFEIIYFEGSAKYGVIRYFGSAKDNADNDLAWRTVKDSLDFSGIQR